MSLQSTSLQIGIILLIMIVAYALAKWKKLSVELSMLSAYLSGCHPCLLYCDHIHGHSQ